MGSYKGSAAGRLWLEELANHYGVGHWCFTVDVDELFVYPFMESADLTTLIRSMEEDESEGMMCVFLDMYSDKPLSETVYEPGTDFRATCPYYEVATYSLAPAALPPYLSITGGPRWRSLWDTTKVNSGPMMKKIPLVKWKDGFYYNYSTHSHYPLKLSNTTGVLQHFKFFSFFAELAETEAVRGDRRQTKDYQNYAKKLSANDPCFFGPNSKVFSNSVDYIRAGITAVTQTWRATVAAAADPQTKLLIEGSQARPGENSLINLAGSGMGLGSLAFLWPHINNESAFETKHGVGKRLQARDITRLTERLASSITLIDVLDNSLLLKVEPLVWTQAACNFRLLAVSGGLVIDAFSLDKKTCYDNIFVNSFDASVVQIELSENSPLSAFAKEHAAIKPRVTFMLMVERSDQVLDQEEVVGAISSAMPPMKAIAKGRVKYFQTNSVMVDKNNAGISFHGTLEGINNGVARGWAVEKLPSNPLAMYRWDVPVSVYLNGWYVGETTQTYKRKDLSFERLQSSGSGSLARVVEPGHGFDFPLPLNFFREKGITDFNLEMRIARRNVVLLRSPCTWQGDTAVWNSDSNSWKSEESTTNAQLTDIA